MGHPSWNPTRTRRRSRLAASQTFFIYKFIKIWDCVSSKNLDFWRNGKNQSGNIKRSFKNLWGPGEKRTPEKNKVGKWKLRPSELPRGCLYVFPRRGGPEALSIGMWGAHIHKDAPRGPPYVYGTPPCTEMPLGAPIGIWDSHIHMDVPRGSHGHMGRQCPK